MNIVKLNERRVRLFNTEEDAAKTANDLNRNEQHLACQCGGSGWSEFRVEANAGAWAIGVFIDGERMGAL